MWISRNLGGGPLPAPIELYYNGTDDADSNTLRYKGSLVKRSAWDNVEGGFMTHTAVSTDDTAYENMFGILAEEQEASATTNYLPNDASFGMRTRKIHPLIPTSIVRGEYSRFDPAGNDNTDTNGTANAAGTAFTITVTTADYLNGGWLYFTNGDNANKLHYITNATTTVITFATATTGAVVAADNFICVQAVNTLWMDFCAHDVTLVSEVADTSLTVPVFGLMTYISAPGIPHQRLDRNKHDGLIIANARFYHDFLIGGSATLGNIWRDTIIRA